MNRAISILKLYRVFLIFIFTCVIAASHAQQSTDSLLKIIKNTPSDTIKLAWLNVLGRRFFNADDYFNAIKYGEQSLKIAKKISINCAPGAKNRIKFHMANSENLLGMIYNKQGNFEKAIEMHNKALALRTDIDLKVEMAGSLCNISNVYMREGNYPKTLEYLFNALKIIEKVNKGADEYHANILMNIANVYVNQDEINKALGYYEKCLMLIKKVGDKRTEGICLGNIGNAYFARKNYSIALENYFASLKISENIKDKAGIAYNLGDIGTVYEKQKSEKDALEYYLKALAIREEIKDKYDIIASVNQIGDYYFRHNKNKEALNYFLRGLSISKEVGSLSCLKNSHSYLSELYHGLKQFDKELYHYKAFTKIKDSIYNKENTKKMLQSQLNYEFDKKEHATKLEQDKKDALAKEEAETQKSVRNSLIGGFIFMIIIGIIILKGYRQKQKGNKLLEMKNVFIEEQNKIMQDKNKDITDSIMYAKRIQQAILPSDKAVKKYLPQSFILYKPKDIVAGDFYWMEIITPQSAIGSRQSGLTESKILLAAADCTGHGVPGALVSVVCSNALNRATLEFGITEPGKVLDKTRELVAEIFSKSDEEIKDGMDISLCLIEGDKLFYSGANNPIWIIRNNCLTEKEAVLESEIKTKQKAINNGYYNGAIVKEESGVKIAKEAEVIELKSDKQPIGIYSGNEKPFTTHEICLQKNDVVYLFTDGFADQFGGPKGKKFKYKSFQELLLKTCNLPMAEQKSYLNLAFEKWKGGLEQVDDVLVMGIKI